MSDLDNKTGTEIIVISGGGIKHAYHPPEQGQIAYIIDDNGILKVKVFEKANLKRVVTFNTNAWRSVDAKWER